MKYRVIVHDEVSNTNLAALEANTTDWNTMQEAIDDIAYINNHSDNWLSIEIKKTDIG